MDGMCDNNVAMVLKALDIKSCLYVFNIYTVNCPHCNFAILLYT